VHRPSALIPVYVMRTAVSPELSSWARTSSAIEPSGYRMTQSEPWVTVPSNEPGGRSPWNVPPVTFSRRRSPSGVTPAQVAIAWVYERARELGIRFIALPGTKRAKLLEQNAEAVDIELDWSDMDPLSTVEASVAGAS
jgi:aryl-alcohol dehydrogenase-like predicted oxidoreductase